MGKFLNRGNHNDRDDQIPLVDGNLSVVVDLSDNTTLIHTGSGRLIAYKVNVVLSTHTVSVEDTLSRLTVN